MNPKPYGNAILNPSNGEIHFPRARRIMGTREALSEVNMSAANLQTRPDFELELVEQWRAHSLERAGYDSESAAVLAASHEIDLHLAVKLAESGCPINLALQILL